MAKIPAWSYSSIKLFETCPRKYQAEKVTKEVAYKDTDATIYGKEVHKVAEDFLSGEISEIPPKYSFIQPYLLRLQAFPGEKFCEIELGVKKVDGQLVACGFKDPEVWFRGIADLVIINGDMGWVVDYKTGKNAKYADTRQLALMAAALFLKYPQLKKLKTSLLFVVSKDFIKENFHAEYGLSIFSELEGLLKHREIAYNTGTWNPRPNGLCRKWCAVTSCPHNGD
jgi:CRISPR/Cas system-associated exonuclease Cas4 (RecB family)